MAGSRALWTTAAWSICAIPGLAFGQVAGGISAETVSKELRSKGFPAKIDQDPDGDPRITTRADGRELQVWFYRCTKTEATADRVCEEIQFFTRFETPKPVPLATVNNWNTRERFAKAYSYKQKSGRVDTHLEIDVIVAGTGAPPPQVFNRYLEKMTSRVKDFERAIAK